MGLAPWGSFKLILIHTILVPSGDPAVKIEMLSSAVGAGQTHQYLISYLINGRIAIDAGCIGLLPLAAQRQIDHVILSHPHMDHLASLPIFVDNTYQPGPRCATIWGSDFTLQCLKSDLFNDRLWPDMIAMSGDNPFLHVNRLADGEPIQLDDLTITPIALDHAVPTFGFTIADTDATVAIVSDTCPTQRVWETLNAAENLRAVFLEASFPNSLGWLAERSMHLTPALFHRESSKLDRAVTWIAVHIKPAFYQVVVEELQQLKLPGLQIGQPGTAYEF